MNKPRNNIDFLLQAPIAHRGLHNLAKKIPENSFAAFKYAAIKKYPIELDIHLLRDSQIAVYHNDTLPDGRKIVDCIRADLPKLPDHSQIPLLHEVLKRIDGKVPLLIEFKTDAPKFALEQAALPLLTSYRGALAIQSFDPRTLHFFKQHAPQIPRGQLISPKPLRQSENLREYLAHHHPDNFYTRPDFISADLNKPLIHTNLPILAWTVRTHSDANAAKRLASNIICEKIL